MSTRTEILGINSQLAEKAKQADLNTTNINVSNNTTSIAAHTGQIAMNTSNIAANATAISALASGSPKGVYATVSALTTAFPSGTTGVYIVTADGKWYYWSGFSCP